MTKSVRIFRNDAQTKRDFLTDILGEASRSSGHPFEPTSIELAAELDGEVVGGLTGQLLYGWLGIILLAVNPRQRGRGIGYALMEATEDYAKQHGALGMHVDTFGYQAAGFYQRCGFKEVSRLPGRIAAEDRIYLVKQLPS